MPICNKCKVIVNKVTHGVVIYCNGNPVSLPEGYVLECHENKAYVARRLITSGKQVEDILGNPTLSYTEKQKIIRKKTVIDPDFDVRFEQISIAVTYNKEFDGSPYQAQQQGWLRLEDFTWLCPECVVASSHEKHQDETQ